MNPLDRYIDNIAEYVVKYGENASWSPLLINKVFLQLMIEQGMIVKFSIGRNPVISQTQKLLYEDYRKGIISSYPKNLFGSVHIKYRNDLSDIETSIDTISESLHELNLPYIWNIRQLKSKIQRIGGDGNPKKTQHIEKIVDDKILSWIDNCNNLDYTHPKIESNLKYIHRIENLEELCNVFTRLRKSGTFGGVPIVDREQLVLQKIKEGFKQEKDASKSIKTTDPYNSILKEGKIDYVINFRYLEFLREKCEDTYSPIIISNKTDKFVIAIGKISKEKVFPSWCELYFFNVTGKSDDEIADIIYNLESFMVLILANKFFIHEDWKTQIIHGTNNLKKELLKIDDNDMLTQLGQHGGDVCIAGLCITKDTINFSMSEIDVKDYITNVYIQFTRALADLRIYSIIENDKEVTSLIKELENMRTETISYKLRFLEKGLNQIYARKAIEVIGHNIKRPIYLFDVVSGNKINCEGLVSLSLFLIFNNSKIFPLNDLKIKVCCAPIGLLQKLISSSPSGIKITQSHMFLIFEFNKEKLLFDSTKITKDFELKLIDEILRSGLYIEIKNIIIEKG